MSRWIRLAAVAVLSGSIVFGQEEILDRAYPAINTPMRDLKEIAALIRTVAQLQDSTADPDKGVLKLRGTVTQIALAEWLFLELDNRPQPGLREYRVPDAADQLVQVFQLKQATESRDLQEILRAVRMVVGIEVLDCTTATGFIAVRGTTAQIRAAGWLISQLDQPVPKQPRHSSSRHTGLPEPYGVLGVVLLQNIKTPLSMNEVDFTLRCVAGIRWISQVTSLNALAFRATSEDVALTEWLIAELDSGSEDPSRPREFFTTPRRDGENLARVFHLKHASEGDYHRIPDLMRRKAHLFYAFGFKELNAVAVLGTVPQVAQAEQIVRDLDQPHPPDNAP